jgi:hypothetical protein
MTRVQILVEGQTEEDFVRTLLAPALRERGVYVTPILLQTKLLKQRSVAEQGLPGRTFKGGVPSYDKVRSHIRHLLVDKQVMVTTMLDFYGLPETFPGMADLPQGTGYRRVAHLEAALTAAIGSPRFRPFLTLHEYEALLFSQPERIAAVYPEADYAPQFVAIRQQFASPEEINDAVATCPSARIRGYLKGYRKPFHGVQIAASIGLATMRQECSHFAGWVDWLESLESLGS